MQRKRSTVVQYDIEQLLAYNIRRKRKCSKSERAARNRHFRFHGPFGGGGGGCGGAWGRTTASATKVTCVMHDGIIHHDQHRGGQKSSFFWLEKFVSKIRRPCFSIILKFLYSSFKQRYSPYDHKGGVSEVATRHHLAIMSKLLFVAG